MLSIEDLRRIRNLEGFLGIDPEEPSCDTYPTAFMSPQEIYDAYPSKHRTRDFSDDEDIIKYIEYDLVTGEGFEIDLATGERREF